MEAVLNLVYTEMSLMNPGTLTIATVTAMTSLYLYFIQPTLLLQLYFRLAVRWSGMKMRYTRPLENGFTFFYGEKGQMVKGQMSMLFLHGFSADHFMWAPIVQNIPSDIHVVALDLPGHGLTSDPVEGEDIGFKGQLKRIKQFLDEVDLTSQPLHVVGVSMGGALAGLFAAEYPDLVGIVTLTCPSMRTLKESRMVKENKMNVLETGGKLTLENCPILPQTAEKLQEMLDISHYFRVKYPVQILKGVVELRKRRNDFYLALVNLIISEELSEMLEKRVHEIKCPAQVIWGREDWIVDFSGLPVLKEKLPHCQRVDVLAECGHAVNLDQPALYSSVLVEFWNHNQVNHLPL